MSSVRKIIGLGLVGSLLGAGVFAWTSGLVQSTVNNVHDRYVSLIAWLHSPISVEHVLAGAGVLALPCVVLFVLLSDR